MTLNWRQATTSTLLAPLVAMPPATLARTSIATALAIGAAIGASRLVERRGQ